MNASESPSAAPQRARLLWQRQVKGRVKGILMPLAHGVVALESAPNGVRVNALSVKDGAPLWRTMVEGSKRGHLARTGKLLCVSTPEQLTLLDMGSGAAIGHVAAHSSEAFGGSVVAREGMFYAVLAGRRGAARVVAIDGASGTECWRFKAEKGSARDTQLHVRGARVLVMQTIAGGKFQWTSLDRMSGKRQWRRKEAGAKVISHAIFTGSGDFVRARGGVMGWDLRDGAHRRTRFSSLEYGAGVLAGQTFLAAVRQGQEDGMLALDVVSGELRGRLPADVTRIIGAHTSEVLTEHSDGYPELFAMPTLGPIALPEVRQIGPTQSVAWARDVAYLLGHQGHLISALALPVA